MTDKNNSHLIERHFRRAVMVGDLCDNSVIKYRESIKRFFKTVGDKNFEDLQLDDFDDFVLQSQKRGNSNSGIVNVIHAMKWVIKRLQSSGDIKTVINLAEIIKPKIMRKEVNYLTKEDIDKFFRIPEKELSRGFAIRKLRTILLFTFLLETGARINEALSIKVIDIDFEHREIPIIGKGGKPRYLFFSEKSEKWIKEYLDKRKGRSEYLFVTLNGKNKWSYNDVCRSFQRYKKLSGIKKDFTIHTFRHTFATQTLLCGVPINTVQFMLGHANLETTMKYYIGAIKKEEMKEFRQDKYFGFMPTIDIENVRCIS